MATIGHRSAIADAFGMKFTGVIGYTMWGFIHVLYLIGWGNRIGTIYTWARALTFSRNRGHRLITFDDARSFGAADDGERAADVRRAHGRTRPCGGRRRAHGRTRARARRAPGQPRSRARRCAAIRTGPLTSP